MQGMAVNGAPAAHTSAYTVTITPTFEVDAEELNDAVLESLEDEGVHPTTATIHSNSNTKLRSGVCCSFDDASSARRAYDIFRDLAGEEPDSFVIKLFIKHPSDGASGGGMRRAGRQICMNPTNNFQIRKPGKDSKYRWYFNQPAQAGAGAAGAEPAATNAEAPGPAAAANAEAAGVAAAAAAAAAIEPLPPPPAEPAASSQRARMGCHRHHTSTTPPSVNRSSSRRRDYRETARELRRPGRERGSGSGSRHHTPHRSHVSRRELAVRLLALRPFASTCHLAAPRRRDAAQPHSGLDEMYIGQQQGQACSIKNVGSLNFPTMLFDSLAGARIMRGVAALLHKEFVPPPAVSVVSDRLKRCYDSLLPTKLRRLLVSDCRAYVGCRHADVDRRGIEAYLTRVLHPMLARR